MAEIPEGYIDLMGDDVKAFASLATVQDDCTPQVTPVWFEYVDGLVWINTQRGRVKAENMDERPHVALMIMDPGNPYRYIQIRGTVVEITEVGAVAHINKLSHKYHGRDYRHLEPTDIRVIYKIRPDAVQARG